MNIDESLIAIRDGQHRAAEDALAGVISDSATRLEPWVDVAEALFKNAPEEGRDALAWTLLDALQERMGARDCIPYCARVLRFFSKSDEFRQRAVDLYQSAHDDDGLESLMDIAGLKGGKPLRRAMQTMSLCLTISQDSFLAHKDDGPPAQVVEIDPSTWNVRIRTPKGEDLLDPVSLGDQYEAAADHDFRVMSQFDPDGFVAQINNEPADIVLTIVQAHHNQLTSDELESMLVPRYVKPGQWAKWWTKTRSLLRKNARVRLEGRNPISIYYEDHEVPLEEALWPRFSAHDPPKNWLDLGQEYIRECKNRLIDVQPEFLARLRDAIRIEAEALEKRHDPSTFSAWLAHDELCTMIEETPDEAGVVRVLDAAESLPQLLEGLPSDAFVALGLAAIRRQRAERWPQDYAELLPIIPPGRADDAAAQLISEGHGALLADVPQQILTNPVGCINGLCWLYQGPKDSSCFELPPLITLLSRILGVLDQTTSLPADQARDVRARARTTLGARRYQRFRDCLAEIDAGMADALRTQVRRCRGLAEAFANDLLGAIRANFAQLWSKPPKQPWEDTAILFCTSQGKAGREAELGELVNVKMKQNAKAIGEAAERGDLSENSEYKFALEERDLLRARVAEIQNQLAICQLIERVDVPVSHVGVGSRVQLRHHKTQDTVEMTFLGPWEANVQQNIFNYQAPISQKLMGLRVGDEVELDFGSIQGVYEVQLISSGVG